MQPAEHPTTAALPSVPAALKFIALCVLIGLAWAFLITLFRAPAPAVAQRGYRAAVQRASPAVVSILADKIVTEQELGVVRDPTLQRFLGVTPVGPARQRLEQNLGSAVIVKSDGTLITNDHVISGFDNIRVLLWDGRQTRATVIGRDAESDLAVLKIDLDNLPAVHFAPSSALQVGDVVLAIGNPYGYSQTVTSGIVSALARPDRNLSTFIQTDAAINVGNSGGALVDVEGNLVGINTAALDRVDVGVAVPGISFAIPSDVVASVLDAILRDGEVIRGWMGAMYGERNVPSASGATARAVMVLDLYQNAPAIAAGMLPGDVIDRFDGQRLLSASQLNALEAAAAPGKTVVLAARRAGVPIEFSLQLTRRPTQ
jgi:serine protease DegQ